MNEENERLGEQTSTEEGKVKWRKGGGEEGKKTRK